MRVHAFKYRWPWTAMIALVLLYGTNWMFTPEVVSVRTLESVFRPKGKRPFDSDKWRQKQASSWGERYEMVDDLLRKHLRLGMSRQEIEELLGKPDLAAPRGAGELELSYNLGSQKDYPARSVLFPGRLGNCELWILLLRFRDHRVYSIEVVPT